MSVFEQAGPRRDLEVSTEEWDVHQGDRVQAPRTRDRVEFPLAFRGYDRAKVDEYLEDVFRLIEELESSRSPEGAVKRALDQVGEQTSGILQRARETEESITARSRARADERLRSAEHEARVMRQQAEARVRKLDEDTDLLWQERHRLLEDIQRLAGQLDRVVDAANGRFPDADAEARAAEGAGVAEDPAPTGPPEAPVASAEPHGRAEDAPSTGEHAPAAEHGHAAEHSPAAEHTSPGPFGEPPAWEGEPPYRDPLVERDGEPWAPEDAEASIAAWRVEDPNREAPDAAGRAHGFDRS